MGAVPGGRGRGAGRGVARYVAVDGVVDPVDLPDRAACHLVAAEEQAHGGVGGRPRPTERVGAEPAVVLDRRCHGGMGDLHDEGPLDEQGGDRVRHHGPHRAAAAARTVRVHRGRAPPTAGDGGDIEVMVRGCPDTSKTPTFRWGLSTLGMLECWGLGLSCPRK